MMDQVEVSRDNNSPGISSKVEMPRLFIWFIMTGPLSLWRDLWGYGRDAKRSQ